MAWDFWLESFPKFVWGGFAWALTPKSSGEWKTQRTILGELRNWSMGSRGCEPKPFKTARIRAGSGPQHLPSEAAKCRDVPSVLEAIK